MHIRRCYKIRALSHAVLFSHEKATQVLTYYLFTLILDKIIRAWVIWVYPAHRRLEPHISLALTTIKGLSHPWGRHINNIKKWQLTAWRPQEDRRLLNSRCVNLKNTPAYSCAWGGKRGTHPLPGRQRRCSDSELQTNVGATACRSAPLQSSSKAARQPLLLCCQRCTSIQWTRNLFVTNFMSLLGRTMELRYVELRRYFGCFCQGVLEWITV